MSNAALLSKYSMAATPENVSRLGTLVANRGADLDKIAKLIAADPGLTNEVLGGDVPASGAADEVERQIFRLGVEPILVLAMSDPLCAAVRRTFETMAGITLKPVDVGKIGSGSEVARFTSSLSVTGRANGKVYLRLGEDLCRALAVKILGVDNASLQEQDLVDVLAEISNMTVGSFQSNLCDAGLSCRLSVPEVLAEAKFAPPSVPRGRHRVFGFKHNEMLLLVDLLVEFAG